jgi:hypothetical protein
VAPLDANGTSGLRDVLIVFFKFLAQVVFFELNFGCLEVVLLHSGTWADLLETLVERGGDMAKLNNLLGD